MTPSPARTARDRQPPCNYQSSQSVDPRIDAFQKTFSETANAHLPPGAAQLVRDEHPTHPVLIDYEDGSRTRAISVAWKPDPAPAGTFDIEDERDVDAHGELAPLDDDDGTS